MVKNLWFEVAVMLCPLPVNRYHTPPPVPLPVPQNGALSSLKLDVLPETDCPQVITVAPEHASPWACADPAHRRPITGQARRMACFIPILRVRSCRA